MLKYYYIKLLIDNEPKQIRIKATTYINAQLSLLTDLNRQGFKDVRITNVSGDIPANKHDRETEVKKRASHKKTWQRKKLKRTYQDYLNYTE